MDDESPRPLLKGKKALICGIANRHSIAYACAKAFRELDAEIAITYVKERTREYVEPLTIELDAPIFMPLDVAVPGMLEAVFERSKRSGASFTSSCTRSRPRPRKTCAAGCSIAPRRDSGRRWTS